MGANTLAQDLREVDAYQGGINSDLSIKTGYNLDVESGATFSIGGTAVTATAAELNLLDTVTSTASELNIMDGCTATATELNEVQLRIEIADVSTIGSVGYVVSPVAGTLTKVDTVLLGAIATAPAVITANVNGGTDVTVTTSILHTSSAAGDVDTSTPADNNTVAVGNYIKLTSSGASTNAVGAIAYITITL